MKAILAAEDDAAIRQLLTMVLGAIPGWSVTALPTGADLLEQAAAATPNLVLLDLHLPGLDGIATYRLLRQREETREVPVLFVTATPEQVADAGLDGNFAVLAKPLRIGALLARAAELLGVPRPTIATGERENRPRT